MKVDAVVLINILADKANYLVKSKIVDAKALLQALTKETSGNGGGKPDFAQGGTQDLSSLSHYLKGKGLI